MAAVAGPTPPSMPGPGTEERRPSIAVVDDDSGFAGYLRTFLGVRGYEARAYTRGDDIVEAVRLGAADYVVKPGDPEGLGEIALDAAIKQAFERTRLVSELTHLRRQLSDDQRALRFARGSFEIGVL